VEARLDVRGRDVWVYAVHLGLPAQDRMDQTGVLLARAATRDAPRVLAGDFNSCPTPTCPEFEGGPDDVYETVTRDHADTRVAAGLPANDADALTYEATRPHERIDYVFATDDFDVLEQRTVRSEAALAASDHLPVVAVLRLRS
jgi:endonuclease/exonuclease/phosphatase family metal-dependent hydrolase